ncbi:Gnt-I system high-affinity gluconate transporter [Cnuella takakiae]|uniref:Gnt-I system high-affinity gluconate transporter n=1 Tax=Cnuella takakiae TaxID=1302690 RepID=A0A1M4Y7H8_9BACT|nr:gluconate:H+ symporter [Cnuella takakiae]OLY93072.1 gluconate transporter [Cnuella takakiae]SHF01668.1 Gnt-I system high-affinity gluconate transporter [Cnuella takakiae]
MTFLIVLACLLLLILLVSWGKFNPFLALLFTAIAAGLLLGIPPAKLPASIQKGIGDTLGSIVLIISFGAMLGKLVSDSGAAQKMAAVLAKAFGINNINWALLVTGFVVGIPMFYNVGFVLLVPLLFSITYQYRLPVVYVGLPMLAALSVMHGFLPPHPSPVALAAQFNASLGLTLIYGLIIATPAVLLAGPLFARTLKGMQAKPLESFRPNELPSEQLPGTFNAFISALLPVVLLAATAALPYLQVNAPAAKGWLQFFSDPTILLLLSLLIALYSLGIAQGKSIKTVMVSFADAMKDVTPLLLIIGGAGALKQVLIDSGVSTQIAAGMSNLSLPPLVLGWLIAAIIRIAVGSATVAGLTAAGIIAPLVTQGGVTPELMVLSVGAGSLVCSHVNDSGFWMYKEYFNLSIRDTFRSWTLMETIVAFAGLGGVLVLDRFV